MSAMGIAVEFEQGWFLRQLKKTAETSNRWEKEVGDSAIPNINDDPNESLQQAGELIRERRAQDAEVMSNSASGLPIDDLASGDWQTQVVDPDGDSKKSQLVAMIVHELHLKEDQTGILLMKLLNYAELFDSKQHDYGPANISMFGEYGVLVRLNDKLQRLINLQKRADAPANESIEDTWRDIGGYGFIGEMLHSGEWAS